MGGGVMADMNVKDFAEALREMADNADRVAQRHDVVEMDSLRVKVAQQAAKAERADDLINELRRQAATMGRVLDAIGRLRKSTQLADNSTTVQIITDALLVIDGKCATFAGSFSCRSKFSSRTRGGTDSAGRWCDPCIARDALERAGVIDVPEVPPGGDAA